MMALSCNLKVLEEQLAGSQEPTQVGLALEALRIRAIFVFFSQ